MKAIDTRGKFEEILNRESLIINNNTLENICKLKEGAKTCRYIMLREKSFICAKRTILKDALDSLVAENRMTAQGDNCLGLGDLIFNATKKENTEESSEEDKKEEKY